MAIKISKYKFLVLSLILFLSIIFSFSQSAANSMLFSVPHNLVGEDITSDPSNGDINEDTIPTITINFNESVDSSTDVTLDPNAASDINSDFPKIFIEIILTDEDGKNIPIDATNSDVSADNSEGRYDITPAPVSSFSLDNTIQYEYSIYVYYFDSSEDVSNGDFNYHFSFTTDVPPSVVETDPSMYETNVDPNDQIVTITFSEPIDPNNTIIVCID